MMTPLQCRLVSHNRASLGFGVGKHGRHGLDTSEQAEFRTRQHVIGYNKAPLKILSD